MCFRPCTTAASSRGLGGSFGLRQPEPVACCSMAQRPAFGAANASMKLLLAMARHEADRGIEMAAHKLTRAGFRARPRKVFMCNMLRTLNICGYRVSWEPLNEVTQREPIDEDADPWSAKRSNPFHCTVMLNKAAFCAVPGGGGI